MIKQILGKIFLTALLPIALLASVNISVNSRVINPGDSVTFTISASGSGIKFPQITDIDGFLIEGTGSSSNVSIVNGSMTKSTSKSYTFTPTKSVTIPSFKVEIDGKTLSTKPIDIKVVPLSTATNNNANAKLEIKLSKSDVYVGEPVRMDLIFKQRVGVHFAQISLQQPKLPNFWVKRIGKIEQGVEGDWQTQTQSYLIFAQKPLDSTIGPFMAKVATQVRVNSPFSNDPFFNNNFFNGMMAQLKWKNIISNSVKLHADALPDNLVVYGKFSIKADVDKREVDADKPVNMKITITGSGNLDDIEKFNPNISDAVVYADDPKVDTHIQNGVYGGTFTEHLAIVSEHDFTIPSLEFKYFDKDSKKEVVLHTKPITIKVKGAPAVASQKSATPHLQELSVPAQSSVQAPINKSKNDRIPGWLYALAGLVVGILSIVGYQRFTQKKDKKPEIPLIRRVKSAKNDKELMKVLLPFIKKSDFISKTVSKLEENIFKNAQNRIDKKELIEYIEENIDTMV